MMELSIAENKRIVPASSLDNKRLVEEWGLSFLDLDIGSLEEDGVSGFDRTLLLSCVSGRMVHDFDFRIFAVLGPLVEIGLRGKIELRLPSKESFCGARVLSALGKEFVAGDGFSD